MLCGYCIFLFVVDGSTIMAISFKSARIMSDGIVRKAPLTNRRFSVYEYYFFNFFSNTVLNAIFTIEKIFAASLKSVLNLKYVLAPIILLIGKGIRVGELLVSKF